MPISFDLQTYDAFATTWDAERATAGKSIQAFWAVFEAWLARPLNAKTREFSARAPLRVLDAGCGNGRHLLEMEKRLRALNIPYELTGSDSSNELLSIARAKATAQNSKVTFQYADFTSLPHSENAFDVVICHAAFHHVLTKDLQGQAAREFARVLKPGGLLWLTVLNSEAPRPSIKKAVPLAKANGTFPLVNIPWRTPQGEAFDRWYYFFEPDDLTQLLSASELTVTDWFWEQDGVTQTDRSTAYNLAIVATKK